MIDKYQRFAELREADPNGHQSNACIERQVDIELLEERVDSLPDSGNELELKQILRSIVELLA